MLKTVLLRFRDLTEAGTIERHREILQAAGYVWWGWWKKEGESTQLADLEQLKEHAGEAGLTIGMFDRSTGEFFIAEVDDVVFSGLRPVESPEPAKTPSYYSDALVPAWFRLASLDLVERKKFESLLSPVPAGEGTFFPVADGPPADATPVDAASEEVKVESNVILHISDLHFGSDYGFPEKPHPNKTPLLKLLTNDLRTIGVKRVGLLIVSGDLTTRADPQALQADASDFLSSLTAGLRLAPEQVVIVPGNHDLPLREHEEYGYKHEAVMRTFLGNFYGKTSPELLSLRPYTTMGNRRKIWVLAMNSVRRRTPEERNYGYVQWPLYEDLLRNSQIPEDALRIAVVHHHLLPAAREDEIDENYREAGVSLVLDAGSIVEGLQKYGFHLVLHGHQHVPSVSRVARGFVPHDSLEMRGLDESLYVIAGGTTGSSRYSAEFRDNSYSVLTVGEKEIDLRIRRFGPAAKPHDFLTGTLRLDH